eukprot:3549843-Amphidinium_carterae.1
MQAFCLYGDRASSHNRPQQVFEVFVAMKQGQKGNVPMWFKCYRGGGMKCTPWRGTFPFWKAVTRVSIQECGRYGGVRFAQARVLVLGNPDMQLNKS